MTRGETLDGHAHRPFTADATACGPYRVAPPERMETLESCFVVRESDPVAPTSGRVGRERRDLGRWMCPSLPVGDGPSAPHNPTGFGAAKLRGCPQAPNSWVYSCYNRCHHKHSHDQLTTTCSTEMSAQQASRLSGHASCQKEAPHAWLTFLFKEEPGLNSWRKSG